MSRSELLRLPEETIEEIRAMVSSAQRVLVVSHIRPDGDSIGSLLGLGLSLRAAGKDIRMVSSDGVPAALRFLDGTQRIHHRTKGNFDLVCVVDCSDLERTGDALEGLPLPDLNIDHHITNQGFGRVNLIEPKAVSTSQLLTALLQELQLPLPLDVVSALLTGLITDSIGFRTSNMTSEAMRTAAFLMDQGADLPSLYRKALSDRSLAATRLWGAGLSSLEQDGRLIWTELTLDDRQKSGYRGKDDADLVNTLASIEEADIALIFLEQPDDRVKVSWRSRPGYDVSQLAVHFGGGGHPAAAGADIQGSLPEVERMVLQATQKALRQAQIQKPTEAQDQSRKGMEKSNGKR
jgi:phosphoesterase RecJ-like protein